MRFASIEEEVAFLRGHVHVTQLVDELIEDCLAQGMGLAAGVEVFTSQCRRLLGATSAFTRIVGTSGPVLTSISGELHFDLEEALGDFGVRPLGRETAFVKELALGRIWLGTFGVAMPPPPDPARVMALVDTMGEQLDSALLSFLALAEGRSPAERLDELSQREAFRPRAKIGRYELLLPLGAGGMGQVFVARQEGPEGMGRLVALKRVLPHLKDDEETTSRFLDEGRIGLRLSHPNLVTVFEFGRTPAGDFLAMELVRGVTLRALLTKLGPLAPAAAVAIVGQALRGLHVAHELTDEDGLPLRLVHRDLSPRNVMVGFDGQVKVLDFGVAKLQASRFETAPGEARGKLRYFSPEQTGADDLDRRSDLFAAATVTYEALTGRLPFEAGSPPEIITAILSHDPPRDPAIPEALWGALQAPFSKLRESRPPTALAMAAALEAACRPLDPTALGELVTAAFPEASAAARGWDSVARRSDPTRERPAAERRGSD